MCALCGLWALCALCAPCARAVRFMRVVRVVRAMVRGLRVVPWVPGVRGVGLVAVGGVCMLPPPCGRWALWVRRAPMAPAVGVGGNIVGCWVCEISGVVRSNTSTFPTASDGPLVHSGGHEAFRRHVAFLHRRHTVRTQVECASCPKLVVEPRAMDVRLHQLACVVSLGWPLRCARQRALEVAGF